MRIALLGYGRMGREIEKVALAGQITEQQHGYNGWIRAEIGPEQG